MKKICSICLAIVLLASLFSVRTYAETVPNVITDKGSGLFQIDAKVTNPDDYKKITGFELTVKLLKAGELGGGAMAANAMMVAQGAYTADDFTMDYDSGVPRYIGKANEIYTFSDSFTAPMFFPHANSDSVFSSEGTTVKYEGNTALFSDSNSILTAYGIFGTFEVTDVKWIFGDITNTSTPSDNENWPVSVETVKYNDVATVEKGTASNYVNIEVPKGEGPFPVILWTHGGGWTTLDRKSCFIRDTMNYLLSKGYAVVSTEYTLTKTDGTVYTTGYPQMIYDLKAAVRYLRANAKKYNLDTSFIAAMGESAGAHLSMLLGTTNGNPAYEDLTMGNANYSSDVQAIVSYFGPSNFVGKENELFGLSLLGNNFTQEQATAVSPYYQITKNCPPLFLTHGKNDAVVPFQQSVDMAAKAKSLIGEDNVSTLFYDDAPHANIGAYDTKLAAENVEQFLDKHLSALKGNLQESTITPSLKKSNVTLYLEGNKKKLTYKIATANSKGYTITYKSSKASVATVSSKGVITAKKAGSTNVTVTFKKESKTYKKTIKVTVKSK